MEIIIGTHLIKILNRGRTVKKLQITDKDFCGSGTAVSREHAAELARILQHFADTGTLRGGDDVRRGGAVKAYTIKPLEWAFHATDDREAWDASSVFGTLTIVRYRGDLHEKYDCLGEWGSWSFNYCVDEYYDEGKEDCESADDGKRLAEVFVLERLSPQLIELTPPATPKPKARK